MIDIELEINKKELNNIFNTNKNNINIPKIKEEIEEILCKMQGDGESIITEFLQTKEDLPHALLLYIKKLYSYLLRYINLDEDKIYSSITIVTNNEIKEINKEYRNLDKVTDVLSFPAIEKETIPAFVEKNKIEQKEDVKGNTNKTYEYEIEYFGDIVISLEKVIKQAEEYGHGIIRELSYLLIHSFLHLLGYDHIEKEDEIVMREEEEKILNILDIRR